MNQAEKDAVRTHVRTVYGNIASSGGAGGCCGEAGGCGAAGPTAEEKSLRLGYSGEEIAAVPEGANMGLGCGNPQAIAELAPGETVVDLGSGGGLDCFLAARRVTEAGRVIGVDMTPEMISKARSSAVKSGYSHVEFRLGEIENLPIADGTADVILSNCVINLSPDKNRVFGEAYRVLKPGGRMAVSDVVALKPIPKELARNMAVYSGCVSGAASPEELRRLLEAHGFVDISVEPKGSAGDPILEYSPGDGAGDYVASAVIRARKPGH